MSDMNEIERQWFSVTGVRDLGDVTIAETYPSDGDDYGAPRWTITVLDGDPECNGIDVDAARLIALRNGITAALAAHGIS
ncbi:hypothetical protein Gbro_1420 [Gordonia bronchialis DSM 43247]|uniref:Uncharacterized protein n=1 Tax=Gordonia bronchialis (strain ATCC 25592 / DSM 43247 / BCRC 13721 / JCM 3198 / KCTC 3076 / NBRC 16047 / NCTC 10667) TaxID=526226 RepID=D0L6E5_GORB4|nr:hypothetical protein [Gordonia bronchialis]ACY20702.1 hypothetical protein Gbro_1420 [Gordonia bronchialis DSM 43247]MCC3323475.1 hypothetical protein [Gordonia bronchialis]QGS25545.1 hypothetical protein FOB84_16770 [Gordonia bronchialis]STQ63531.1 Uncharacterised protein [Gordonia bronchialis]